MKINKEKILQILIGLIGIIIVVYVGLIILKDIGIKMNIINELCNESDSKIIYYKEEIINCSVWTVNETFSIIS